MNSSNYYYNNKNENMYVGCFVLFFEKPLSKFPNYFVNSHNLTASGLKVSDDYKTIFIFVNYEFDNKRDFSAKNIIMYLDNAKSELVDLSNQLFKKIKYENRFGKVLFKYKDGRKVNLNCPKTLIEEICLFRKLKI
jgi:hypothetical protein